MFLNVVAVLLVVLASADAVLRRQQQSETEVASQFPADARPEYDDSEADADEVLMENSDPPGKQQAMPQQVVQQQALKSASLASTKAEVTIASRAASGTGSGEEARAKGPGTTSNGVTRPKGWDQCLKFARNMKAQDVTGVELIRVWKSTCEPAVQAGH